MKNLIDIKNEYARSYEFESWAAMIDEIIDDNDSCGTANHLCQCYEDVIESLQSQAKEETYPAEFIEWCIKNVEHKPIQYRVNGRIFLNLPELFKYWNNNIKGK